MDSPPRTPTRQPAAEPQRGGFRLVRHFTLTSLAAFLVVAGVLYVLERRESDYFREVQREQAAFLNALQNEFAREQTNQARFDLVTMHEAEHVNLTRLIANALWDTHLAALVRQAGQVPIDHCRALAGADATACFAAAGRAIQAMPELRALDAKLVATMKKTSVFKVKVFDVRGLTIYSSERQQIGEDKRSNEGWWIAADGLPASELTHRDTFSAFEGVVENRDLISTYVPVFAPGGASVLAVFEIYSDVTPFLHRIAQASEHVKRVSANNHARLQELAAANQRKVDASSYLVLASVGGLLVLLYGALLLLVRRGQTLIDAQAREREQSIRREERLHREKMSVLATMAATLGHEIGNPLATITAIAEQISARKGGASCAECRPEVILEQSRRIAAKTRQIEDFAAARGESVEPLDVNDTARAVCEFLSFDRRFAATTIDFHPGSGLPARELVADHLTEALMNLLQAHVDDESGSAQGPRRIVVETASRGADVVIRMASEGAVAGGTLSDRAADARIEAASRRLRSMGAHLTISGAGCEIVLPPAAQRERRDLAYV